MKPKPKPKAHELLAGRLAADAVRKIAPQLAPGSKEHEAVWTAILEATKLAELCGLGIAVKDAWEATENIEGMGDEDALWRAEQAQVSAYIELCDALGWEVNEHPEIEAVMDTVKHLPSTDGGFAS